MREANATAPDRVDDVKALIVRFDERKARRERQANYSPIVIFIVLVDRCSQKERTRKKVSRRQKGRKNNDALRRRPSLVASSCSPPRDARLGCGGSSSRWWFFGSIDIIVAERRPQCNRIVVFRKAPIGDAQRVRAVARRWAPHVQGVQQPRLGN